MGDPIQFNSYLPAGPRIEKLKSTRRDPNQFLPSHPLVVVRVEVRVCPLPHVGAPVGCLHCVAARHAHVPEDHATRALLLALDAEAA